MSSDDVTSAPARVLDGRYVLGDQLGRGGMAEVYQARDTMLERAVAIKLFHQTTTLPDGELRRSAEVRLLAGLSHPGLVTLFDAGRDASNPDDPFTYLVMELVEGSTLARLIAGGPLPGDQLARIGQQIADALAYVHERGVVHRDIKPANVLVNSAGTSAKLADFGVARLVDSTRLTAHGTTLGTPDYLSPEQASGEPVGKPSDIYSLGLVLLEALSGQRPFPGTGVEAAVVRVHRTPPIPTWATPDWRALIGDMTALEPGARPDAATVVRRLAAMQAATASTAPTAVLGKRHAAARLWRPVWWAAAVAVLVVVAGVLIGVVSSGNDAPSPLPPSYPPVAGTIGVRVQALEAVVPASLQGDALAVAETAADGNVTATRAALSQLASDLQAARTAGDVSDAQYAATTTAIAALSTQLSASASSSPASTPTSTPTSPVVAQSTPAPAPPAKPGPKGPGPKPGPKPGKHKGHGPGDGGDDGDG